MQYWPLETEFIALRALQMGAPEIIAMMGSLEPFDEVGELILDCEDGRAPIVLYPNDLVPWWFFRCM